MISLATLPRWRVWPHGIGDAGEEALNTAELARIETVIELCCRARDRLKPDASFRLRVLLDMTLLELGKELARLGTDPAA